MTQQTDWCRLKNPEAIDSPALLVYPERVKHNNATAIIMAGSPGRLRPHVKTSKSPGAVHLMQQAGITKFKCATIAEAEMLGMENAKDVLLAYQPIGPKLERYISLIKKYPLTHYSCLVDNLEIAQQQVTFFSNAGIRASVYVDINVGMNRSGIAPGSDAIQLLKYLFNQDAIEKVGLHVYDGHLRGSIAEKEKAVDNWYEIIDQFLNEIVSEGLPTLPIVAGGSPTFSIHAKRNKVECSPGTFVYWDKTYMDLCPEQNFLPAAIVLCRVISQPGAGLITVDLGHKSIASENEITRRVFFPGEPGLVPISHSEEHLVLRNEGNKSYKPGDVLYGIPFHICPTVALYEKAYTVEDGKVSGKWLTVARDRFIEL